MKKKNDYYKEDIKKITAWFNDIKPSIKLSSVAKYKAFKIIVLIKNKW